MLTKAMRKYVKSKTKAGYTKETQAVYNGRLREYVVEAFKDLTLIAGELPEEQQGEMFNKDNMAPFFKELFKLSNSTERRKRIVDLWHALFSNISPAYGLKLVSKEVWTVLASQPIPHIQAIYYATLFH